MWRSLKNKMLNPKQKIQKRINQLEKWSNNLTEEFEAERFTTPLRLKEAKTLLRGYDDLNQFNALCKRRMTTFNKTIYQGLYPEKIKKAKARLDELVYLWDLILPIEECPHCQNYFRIKCLECKPCKQIIGMFGQRCGDLIFGRIKLCGDCSARRNSN